ncbi:MAG TPA: polymer-forming cytoskeletal protein [Thermomicrobiaceae bacterium]|nr:polymer-forming cytoskeletal protein [Thermomicrobiaceae bacterium]
MSYRDDEAQSGPALATGPAIPESYSLIDRHTGIEGTVTSERDLRIEGKLRGELRCQGLVQIAEGADVDATIQADRVTVAGNLKGKLTCNGRFQILPTGRVQGTLVTRSLVINEGAIFEGELRMEGDSQSIVTAPAAQPESRVEEDETTQLLRRIAGGDDARASDPSPSSESGGSTSSSPEGNKRHPR